MNETKIKSVIGVKEKNERLKVELEKARQSLMEAEAELAQEQAAVNAFRMHCRLKLDELVDSLMELKAQKQSCLTHLALLQQGIDPDLLAEDDDPLADISSKMEDEPDDDDLLLPTPTPGDKIAEKRLYRELARRFHPDLATSIVERSYRTTMMAAVNNAYSSRDLKSLYDLAVELDPNEVLELSGIENLESRRLRELIMKARHQRRKARRQLKLLRQENTARLWAKAQVYDEKEGDWWSLVKRELEQAINKRKIEIAELMEQIDLLGMIESSEP